MKIDPIQFHPEAAAQNPLAIKLRAAEEAIYQLYKAGHPVYYGFSGGKDSATITDIGLRAAVRAKRDGYHPISVVGTSRTLVENPEIEQHYLREHAKISRFAQRHGISVRTELMEPSLASTWQVKILSGRGLPSFAGGSSDCTVDLKTGPQKSFRNMLFRDWKARGLPAPVTIIGVRREESTTRAARMAERGDSAIAPVANKAGELVLSPIADWSELDVFEHLGNISNGLLESYSDMKETDRIYAHSAGTSCSVVAMDVHEARRSPGCGARHGCWTCQKAEDKSLAAMIEYDPRYEYARGLNRFNQLLRATRWDWSKRHWVGRTIKGGFIEIKPDTYHPTFIRDLTRYMLQLDFDEKRRARAAGESPKFQIFTLEMLIAIDALQNMNGLAKPFQIWADYRDIYKRGIRYDIPDVEPVPKTPMPKAKYLYVGDNWDSTTGSAWTGMRSDYLEGLLEDSPCQRELRELKNGHVVWDVERDVTFSVDTESACMIEGFELDHLLDQFDNGTAGGSTWGYKWYLQYGCLTLSNGQHAKHDEVLRRTAFKHRQGLTMNYSVDDLVAAAVPFEDLPVAAKMAWKTKSALEPAAPTDAGPQYATRPTPDREREQQQDEEQNQELEVLAQMGFKF